MNKPLVKTLLFTLLVPTAVTIGIPYLLRSPRADFQLGPLRHVGILLIALGAGCYLRCAWDFAWVGQGTPAPIDPPRLLVSRGLYRAVRNPMYVGVALVLLGEAVFFQSLRLLAYALLAWLLCHLFVVFYEEPTLRKKFGAAYEAYCQTVPRWIPRIGRLKSPDRGV